MIHSLRRPPLTPEVCDDGELSSLLVEPPHVWGSIPASCLFFDLGLCSSPISVSQFPGLSTPDMEPMGECCPSLLNCLLPSVPFLPPCMVSPHL